MLAAAVEAHAQYKITGDIDSLADGKVYLLIHGQKADSSAIVNGHFEMAGKEPMEAPVYVGLNTSGLLWGTQFWLGNDDVTIKGNIHKADLNGSKTEDEYQEYCKVLKPVWDFGMKVKQSMKGDVSKADSIRNIIENVYKPKEDSAFMVFAKAYPSSYVTLNHIYNMRILNKYPFEKYTKYAKVLTPGAFRGRQWETFMHVYRKDSSQQAGNPFMGMRVPDVYGKVLDVASLKGHYVLVTVSNYGVSDYDNDLELRRELYSKYHDKGLEMVDYMPATKLTDVIKAPANFGLRWHFVSELKGWNSPWMKANGIDHITQNYLLGKDGTIIARDLFGNDLEKEIQQLF